MADFQPFFSPNPQNVADELHCHWVSVSQCHSSVYCPVSFIGCVSPLSVFWLANLGVALHMIGRCSALWSWSQKQQQGVVCAEGELTHPSINSQNAVHLQKAVLSPRRQRRKGYSTNSNASQRGSRRHTKVRLSRVCCLLVEWWMLVNVPHCPLLLPPLSKIDILLKRIWTWKMDQRNSSGLLTLPVLLWQQGRFFRAGCARDRLPRENFDSFSTERHGLALLLLLSSHSRLLFWKCIAE